MTSPGWMHVSGVTRRFGSVTALDGVDLEIQQGEFVCLLGPSGCGKTTLLRVIAGLERQDAGHVWLRGESLDGVPPERRELGVVFQNYALFPHLTVFDNVAFPLRSRQWFGRHRRPPELTKKVLEALSMVDLDGFEDRLPSQISGGQAQRVALARAIVPDPSVVLLDEPLSALDLKVRQQMRLELKSLQQRLGTTFVLVTHDQDEALVLASRIALMQDGRVEQLATPSEMYRTPATRFASEFIGEQSYVRAHCQGRNDSRLRVRWGDVQLAPVDRATAKEGDTVDVMLRPEEVQLHRNGSAAPAIEATVRSRAFRGATVDVELAIGEDVVRMSCSADEFNATRAGEMVFVSISEGAGVAFDAEGRGEASVRATDGSS